MLKIDNLKKNYGSFPALKGLSLEIPDGALHGFVGPNGAGKTTTMRILATLMKPTSGTAWVDGTDVVKDGQKARKLVGYMPDFFGVLNLEEKENEYVDALSRGMKQRLCLARSLIHDPKLLILDEPASGMDPRARAEMKGILRTLREMGKTVLISSHILPELAEMCDSLTILDHGQLVFSGGVDELSDRMNGNAPLDIRLSEGCGDENVDAAVRCLKEMPAVTEILREEPYLLRIRLGSDADVCEDVLRQLVMKGVPVCDFHRAPMNLEKVFMEVTQDA